MKRILVIAIVLMLSSGLIVYAQEANATYNDNGTASAETNYNETQGGTNQSDSTQSPANGTGSNTSAQDNVNQYNNTNSTPHSPENHTVSNNSTQNGTGGNLDNGTDNQSSDPYAPVNNNTPDGTDDGYDNNKHDKNGQEKKEEGIEKKDKDETKGKPDDKKKDDKPDARGKDGGSKDKGGIKSEPPADNDNMPDEGNRDNDAGKKDSDKKKGGNNGAVGVSILPTLNVIETAIPSDDEGNQHSEEKMDSSSTDSGSSILVNIESGTENLSQSGENVDENEPSRGPSYGYAPVSDSRTEKEDLIRNESAVTQIDPPEIVPSGQLAVFNVTVLVSKPSELPDVPGFVYQYLDIRYDGTKQDSYDISFKVSKDWMDKNHVTKDDIIMYRYDNEWKALETEIVAEDEANVYYKSQTGGFSYFAIAGERDPVDAKVGMWVLIIMASMTAVASYVYKKVKGDLV